MKEQVVRHIFVHDVLDSYRNFFDNEWSAKLLSVARGRKHLEELLYDLILEWRGAVYTTALPHELLESIRNFHDGFVKSNTPNTDLLRLSEGIRTRFNKEIDELRLDTSLSRIIQEKIVQIGAEIIELHKNAPIEFPIEQGWQDYLEIPAYKISIWGSQRISFVALYNSYDNFITQCTRIAKGLNEYRRKREKEFKKDFRDAFGEELLKICWTNDELNMFRAARNSLTHAGGRVTDELRKYKHDFELEDDRIQVTPDKTKALYNLLKKSVLALSEKAAAMQQFST